MKLGLTDPIILEEISDLFEEQGYYKEGVQALELIVNDQPKNGDVLQKLGNIYWNAKNRDQDKEKAIEAYKKAIVLVQGNTEK